MRPPCRSSTTSSSSPATTWPSAGSAERQASRVDDGRGPRPPTARRPPGCGGEDRPRHHGGRGDQRGGGDQQPRAGPGRQAGEARALASRPPDPADPERAEQQHDRQRLVDRPLRGRQRRHRRSDPQRRPAQPSSGGSPRGRRSPRSCRSRRARRRSCRPFERSTRRPRPRRRPPRRPRPRRPTCVDLGVDPGRELLVRRRVHRRERGRGDVLDRREGARATSVISSSIFLAVDRAGEVERVLARLRRHEVGVVVAGLAEDELSRLEEEGRARGPSARSSRRRT